MRLPTQQSGFTLIEIVVTLGIAIIGIFAITQITQLYLKIVANEKFRVTAAALANQKIETVRNLPYSSIGTIGGIPPGNLVQTETVFKNNKEFTVTTEVIYIDDPFDGLISTTGSDNSIYNASSSEILYYWSMDSNTEGQSPDVGSGTLSFTGTSVTTGQQGNGVYFDGTDKVTTSAFGNIDINEGRIGIWYKPDLANSDHERLVDIETSSGYLYLRRMNTEKLQLSFGSGSVKSDSLTWNSGQWYFIEAAWEGTDYKQIWRDGVPLALNESATSAPTIQDQMNIGNRGDNSELVNGVLDELYILNAAHKYEIWGYNQSNPFFESNPQVTFYWDMNSTDATQTPQVGSGNITVGGSITAVDPAVQSTGINFEGHGETDYATFSTTDNIDFSLGRVGVWYKPRSQSVYGYNTPNIISANCTNGYFSVTRDSDYQINFEYGSNADNVLIESQARGWNSDWWYFLEAAWDDASDEVVLYVNREEVARSSTSTISMPSGCTSMFVANNGISTPYNGEGQFDEMYILDDAFPDSDTADLLNTDYKRVKVTVEWQDSFAEQTLFLLTDIAPQGIESTDGGGTLSFTVIDASGIPVPNATIDILNTTLNPIVNLSLTTNSSGQLLLPGAPATSSSYEIIVSKTGYSTDYTAAATSTYTSPTRDHLTVIEGATTEISFAIDVTSDITVSTVSQSLPVNWKLNNNTTDSDQLNPHIAHTDTQSYFVWQDERTASTSLTYAQKYSVDSTQQWLNDTNVDTGSYDHFAPRVTLDASENQYIAWYENASSSNDIYLMKLDSSGSTAWGSAVVVNSDAGSNNQINPDITYSASSSNIFVVWQDGRNDSGDIYLQKYDTAGTKLFGSDIKINTDSGSALQSRPRISTGSDGSVYISWLDNRGGQNDIYMHKVDASGSAIWANEIQVNASAATITNFDANIANDDTVYIAWSDNPSSHYNIYWQGVASTSVLAFGSDQSITTGSPSSNQQNIKVAPTDDDNLIFGWNDDRGAGNDIYVHMLDTNGTAQWPQEVQLNLETTGEQIISDLSVYDTNKLIAAWTDYSQVDPDVWAGTLNYDGSETPVPFIDFDLRGSKLTHSSPDLLKYDESFTTDASGVLTITDLEWDTYELDLTDVGVSLVQIDPPSPFVLTPGTSTAIKLIVN